MTQTTATGRPIEILLVEDNPGDARLTREAFKEGKLANNLSVVTDGVEALEFLRQEGEHAEVASPDIILLDLNLPKKGGHELLEEMKRDPVLKRIPVVVLTSSRVHEDILSSYNLHANCFVTKPVDLEQFIKVTRAIEQFWFTVVTLPDRGTHTGA